MRIRKGKKKKKKSGKERLIEFSKENKIILGARDAELPHARVGAMVTPFKFETHGYHVT
jgi:hypothetical protein